MTANQKPRRYLLYLLIGVAGVYLLVSSARLTMSRVDYWRIDTGGVPMFATKFLVSADGGSAEFNGFGYTITRSHRVHATDDGRTGFLYGPILKYERSLLFFPLSDRANLRFVAHRVE